MYAHVIDRMAYYATTNPEHCCGSYDCQKTQKVRHELYYQCAKAWSPTGSDQEDSIVISFDDQRNATVNEKCNYKCNNR